MKEQILYIDNMVCYRCVIVVRQLLEAAGWKILNIEIGYIRAVPMAQSYSKRELFGELAKVGLRLRTDGHSLVAQVKGVIIDYVYDDQAVTNIPLSEIVIRKVNLSYSHISRHFSSSELRTIEEFYQSQRIERAKRLLFETNRNIKSVAKQLKYRSPAHFSASFRKVTGETPSDFRNSGKYSPRAIDEI